MPATAGLDAEFRESPRVLEASFEASASLRLLGMREPRG
jgi:hypothetical protein